MVKKMMPAEAGWIYLFIHSLILNHHSFRFLAVVCGAYRYVYCLWPPSTIFGKLLVQVCTPAEKSAQYRQYVGLLLRTWYF